VKHRLSFEVRPETLALFRDLQARVQGDLGEKVDDDTLLFELARRALAGPDDEGRASYQVAVTRCDACALTSIDAGGVSEPVDTSVAAMAQCDGQHIGEVVANPHVGAAAPSSIKPAKRATQSIPPACLLAGGVEARLTRPFALHHVLRWTGLLFPPTARGHEEPSLKSGRAESPPATLVPRRGSALFG
jgi:hypothetical protein